MSGTVNRTILIGRLGQDPIIRETQTGSKIATFSIATDDSYKNKEGIKQEITDWHNIVSSRSVEFVEKYIKKGSKVYIEGKLKTRKWEDKQGITKYTTSIHANKVEALDKKEEGDNPDKSFVGNNYKDASQGF